VKGVDGKRPRVDFNVMLFFVRFTC
jgi:hypothetical protein